MGNFKRAFDLCSLSQKVFTSDGSYRLFGRYSSAIIFTGLGLALMFGGIWIGDAQVLTALNASWGTLVMRVFSCLIYLCLFLMLLRMHRQGKDPRPFLLRSVRITCLALVLGMVIICIMLPFYADGSSLFLLWGIVALFLTKCIGAPVSVLLVCAFARLDRARTIRLVTFGMIGAFTFYSLISQLYTAELISDLCVIVFSCVMLCASGLLGCIGSGLWTSVPYDNKNDSLTDDAHAIGRLGVIKRPVRQVMSPGFLMEACFSAIMLGFLRSGMQISDPHMQPIVIVTLLILILVALMWRGLCVEYIFNGALICTSVGLLLCPIFDVGGDAAVAVDGIGTALFEVVMWSLAVWAARNSRETLLAAAGTRFASVCGHLLGTIIMLLGFYAAGSSEEALRICAPFIVFAYMLMLLILLKWPGL
ncbi:MAG: hypothetical protein LKF61_06805 [Eggerthellaceae bacterium]|jgi:hypothetical protein|nr:hypothetical protein [Eggerthellaceae bacterium]MCH4220683.1 hypothetical protein [Eggerthellaceae bacterium]